MMCECGHEYLLHVGSEWHECHDCPCHSFRLPESTGYLAIDPICQILMDFVAYLHEENAEGKTYVVQYGEWADKIRKHMDQKEAQAFQHGYDLSENLSNEGQIVNAVIGERERVIKEIKDKIIHWHPGNHGQAAKEIHKILDSIIP